MKKQFFRVKQLADQTFLRAERSEILNHEELQIADQRAEFMRSAITSIMKKIVPNGPTNDVEKLMKKCIEYQLGISFIEEGKSYQECQLFQQVLRDAGLIEQQLAREYAEHEIKVEEMVYSPLQNALENEFPNVIKHKHNLRKYCLDKDSASNRYNATRKETIKEDMEEADTKVEQSRDMLAIEMFNILAKENEFSEYILQLLKLQRGYHESALKHLETVIPHLEKKIGNSPIRKVFGTTLKEHLRITGKKIAYPLEICIQALSEYGMVEEGLFRVAGSATKVKRLKSAIDSGCFSWLIPEYRDAHVLASVLKLYLRELPEPLLTFQLHKEWLEAMQCQEDQRLKTVKSIIERLPQENKDNLCYLFQFLFKFTQHTENKMSPSNLAIVLSPSLLWTKDENINIGNCVMINMLIELFIKEATILFPDDVSKYVTLSRVIQDEEILNHNIDDTNLNVSSPKPSVRKKKSAPVPPNNENVITTFNINSPNIKRRENEVNLGIDFDESHNSNVQLEDSSNREQYKNQEKKDCLSYTGIVAQENRVEDILDYQAPVEKYENIDFDKINQVNTQNSNVLKSKPHDDKTDKSVSSHTKSQDIIDPLQNLKKTNVNIRAPKPEVPARPVSFSKKLPSNPVFKKTHCSVYNVADKLQPSIINIEKETSSEKPLDLKKPEHLSSSQHFTAVEDGKITTKLYEIDTNEDNKKSKSTEQLQLNANKLHSNNEGLNTIQLRNHIRAKSDGGVADLAKENNQFVEPASLEIHTTQNYT